MARFRGRRPFRTRRGGRRQRPRWTADFIDLTPATGAIASQVLLSEADFGVGNTLESECTLLRLLLSGTFICTIAGISSVGAGICMVNENVVPTFGATHDPLVVDSLVDDDWLWTQRLGLFNAAGPIPSIFNTLSLDLRVKRRLKSNDVLRFVVSNAAAGVEVDFGGMARLLVTPRL